MTQKLTFVNGAKAACGCRHEFSSGGGEYSDVASVHLCAMHAGSPVLDDRWKARMLDGRAPERDEMGFGNHPELPSLDEGMMPRSFFAALGLELTHTSAEDQLDGDVLGAMSEAVNWTDWLPTPPHGDGWKLVSIFDTEDGPVAWWLRELPEAEDGTTTIRNLQAEVKKLEARIARLSRAGAAPAAVAPQGERQWICPTRTVADLVNNLLTMDQALPIYGAQYIEKDGRRCAIAVPPTVSRERVQDGRWIGQGEELNAAVVWTRAEQPAAVAGPVLDVRAIAAAVCQRVAELPDRNSPEDWPEAMLVTGQELIDVVTCELEQAQAAPALEAPAAPADGATPGPWFVRKREVNGELRDCFVAAPDCQGLAYDACILCDDEYHDGVGRKLADCELIVAAVNQHRAALAAAPQAPAAPWKDHLTARLVNDLRDCAIKYHGAGQLRDRIAHIVAPLCDQLKAAQAAPPAPAVDAQPLIARNLAEWHEDDGDVAWWAWCGHGWAGEPAWIGRPTDDGWPGYHTHWTAHPAMPPAVEAQAKDGGAA